MKDFFLKLSAAFFGLTLIISIVVLFSAGRQNNQPAENINQAASQSLNVNQNDMPPSPLAKNVVEQKDEPAEKNALLREPINRALERVTKKPFGIYISPQNSPISPERFVGYHTGADFEIFAGEENLDVPVFTVCTGPLVLKKTATGYGGVAAQKRSLNRQDVTVIYGHLRLASISASVGDEISAGSRLGILGKGKSVETDGERQHLHLSIHQGTAVNLLGYVSNVLQLGDWLNPVDYLTE